MRFEITLKSGAKVQFDAEEVTTSAHGMKWTSSQDQAKDKLMRVDYDEVAAVVRLK